MVVDYRGKSPEELVRPLGTLTFAPGTSIDLWYFLRSLL